ncbi:MAG: GNAT family N-acetyltransferase [Candidatus Limnocylindrales bacterium]
MTPRVWTVEPGDVARLRPRLGELLIDSVEHGASVGFLVPLSAEEADSYWGRIERKVVDGLVVLFGATFGDGPVVGTVQLDIDTLPNQPHRATVSKLLVLSTARRHGIGEALMAELERVAAERGRWLLTLDTATPEAERLYGRMGWSRSGAIPDYAMNPDRSLTPTTFFWKDLRANSAG